MAFQSIEIGTTGNDGTGDTLRAGGDKINDNFSEIYTLLGTGTALTSGISATSTVVSLSSPTVTGVASFADGSAGAPSITNTGDANTGIYFSAADEVAISTGGTARLTISSTAATFAGNIAIADDGTIGTASDADAITIAAAGAVTFSQRDVHSSGITIADGGQIGSASDADSIAIAANGVVTFSQAPVFPDGSIALVDLDIDGGTDIGADLATTDLIIVDDGAGGTNRKAALSRVVTLTESSATALAIALG
jgi:hypothetical protein